MAVRVLFILEQQRSFVARTLIGELEKRGIEIVETKNDSRAIAHMDDVPKIWFLNICGPEDDLSAVLSLAKITVGTEDIRFFVGGAKSEINYFMRDFPGEMVVKTFTRPFSADDIAESFKDEAGNIERSFYAKKILVVDDDPVLLHNMKDLLSESYRVFTANSGLNAIKLLSKVKVDLILLDYEMPSVKGPEVADMIKSNSDTADIPIMFLTSKNDVRSVVSASQTGSVDYILKSTAQSEILQKISRIKD